MRMHIYDFETFMGIGILRVGGGTRSKPHHFLAEISQKKLTTPNYKQWLIQATLNTAKLQAILIQLPNVIYFKPILCVILMTNWILTIKSKTPKLKEECAARKPRWKDRWRPRNDFIGKLMAICFIKANLCCLNSPHFKSTKPLTYNYIAEMSGHMTFHLPVVKLF